MAILQERLWYNSNIKIQNKLLIPETNDDLNIKVRDLFNGSGTLIKYNDFCAVYSYKPSWLKYRQILSAIPEYWKKVLKKGSDVATEEDFELFYFVNESKKCAHKLYYKMTVSEKALTQAYEVWHRKINAISYNDILEGFKNIKKVTNIVKLQNFQYKLLHNIIFCNDHLFYWKKVDSQQCEWCIHKQTIVHLLYECENTQKIWYKICKN